MLFYVLWLLPSAFFWLFLVHLWNNYLFAIGKAVWQLSLFAAGKREWADVRRAAGEKIFLPAWVQGAVGRGLLVQKQCFSNGF